MTKMSNVDENVDDAKLVEVFRLYSVGATTWRSIAEGICSKCLFRNQAFRAIEFLYDC